MLALVAKIGKMSICCLGRRGIAGLHSMMVRHQNQAKVVRQTNLS